MIPRSQIKRIIDGRETTFVRFELKIIFVFSVQNWVIDNKQWVHFAKICQLGKPHFAASDVVGGWFHSWLTKTEELNERISLDTYLSNSLHSDGNKHFVTLFMLRFGVLFFFQVFFSLVNKQFLAYDEVWAISIFAINVIVAASQVRINVAFSQSVRTQHTDCHFKKVAKTQLIVTCSLNECGVIASPCLESVFGWKKISQSFPWARELAAERASSAEQANEWAVRANEWAEV